MRDDFPNSAPDYTRACLVMFGVNVLWVLVAIWAIWGLIAALALGWALNRGVDQIGHWRRARAATAIRRGKPFTPPQSGE